ncbi:MAG: hypothetical protein HYW51_01065 [Candidatus Doudnabacteria bacterium]|nr:hypothetical protein [Candidatus Doudnabacteria bacterium]
MLLILELLGGRTFLFNLALALTLIICYLRSVRQAPRLPPVTCMAMVVSGITLFCFSLNWLMLAEGEPWIWSCQGLLSLYVYVGMQLIALGFTLPYIQEAKRSAVLP